MSGISENAVWGIDPINKVFKWKGGNSWERVRGTQDNDLLKQVSVGEPGVWGVGKDNRVWFRTGTNGGER